MTKPVITGSWIDIMHLAPRDGVYWNRKTIAYSKKEWHTLIRHLKKDLGIELLMIQNVAVQGASLYPSRIMKEQIPTGCDDPVGAIFQACSEEGVDLYPGIGAPNDVFANEAFSPTDEASVRWHREVSEEMLERYGNEPSFAGFYMSSEMGMMDGQYRQEQVAFSAALTTIWGELLPGKPRIGSPWIRKVPEKCDSLVKDIVATGLDVIAYQDGRGFATKRHPSPPEENATLFETLKWAHDKAGVTLWANTELFKFENDIIFQPLIPADFVRIQMQIELAAPSVEKVVAYTVPGIMTSQQVCPELGVPETDTLYAAYRQYLDALS